MRSSSWFAVFVFCALLGAVAGYFLTLVYRPALLPPVLRFGGLTTPTTILLLGTDVVYTRERRHLKADQNAFSGRSDTIMVARLDPIQNSLTILSIPRDTNVRVPGHGRQKINGANALGGARLVGNTIYEFLGVSPDHYVVINVHGLVELVDELGGITVEVPKKMRYNDNSAKLHIDLTPGPHLLNGTQAMGFVRFRHDSLGDIGRVQRQEIFLKAVQDKALDPSSWAKVPKLMQIAMKYVETDMSTGQLIQMATFARAVPKERQNMFMLPGHFSGTGDWACTEDDINIAVSRLLNKPLPMSARDTIRISVENASSSPDLARKLYKYLSSKGYSVIAAKSKSEVYGQPPQRSRIIAQRGNTEEAVLVKQDLQNNGDIVNASLGDIDSSITILAGDDVTRLVVVDEVKQPQTHRKHHRH